MLIFYENLKNIYNLEPNPVFNMHHAIYC